MKTNKKNGKEGGEEKRLKERERKEKDRGIAKNGNAIAKVVKDVAEAAKTW